MVSSLLSVIGFFDVVDRAFDATTRVRPSSSTTVCNAMRIDYIDLAQLIDEEDWVLRYRLAGSNIPCNSTPLNHLYRR
jgi:hypothetical protein